MVRNYYQIDVLGARVNFHNNANWANHSLILRVWILREKTSLNSVKHHLPSDLSYVNFCCFRSSWAGGGALIFRRLCGFGRSLFEECISIISHRDLHTLRYQRNSACGWIRCKLCLLLDDMSAWKQCGCCVHFGNRYEYENTATFWSQR